MEDDVDEPTALGPVDTWRLIDDTRNLWVQVANLVSAAGDGPAAEDAAVVERRMVEADRLMTTLLDVPPPDVDGRTLRHDLMNALGAIDNYSELIAFDDGLKEATAVRDAVRRLVLRIRGRPAAAQTS